MIRIQHDEHFTDEQALERVLSVVRGGRISETSNGKQYCFVTSWSGGECVVYADRTRAGIDSFRVFKEQKQ